MAARSNHQSARRPCGSVTRWGRRLGLGVVVAVGAMVGALCGPGAVADAATPTGPPGETSSAVAHAPRVVPAAEDFTEGLRVEANATYTVDLAAAVVHVVYVATLVNQVPNETTASYVRRFYFSDYSVPVLTGATNVAAGVDGGGPLAVRVDPGDAFTSVAVIDLAPDLYYGETRTIRLTYDLATQPPRSGAPAQVNQAFATFPVFATADPGLSGVTVVLPSDLEVEVVGSDMQSSVADGSTVYTATGIADPATWFATVIARDDDALVERLAYFDDIAVRVQGWPGDPEWLAFTADLAERGLPALNELIGRHWNATGQLDIVETSAPYVYGYSGWYEHSRSLIEVGDDLDPFVTLHEMAHVWFNQETFVDRWVNEALANEYASLAMAELDLERPMPEAVAPDDSGALPLNTWAHVDLSAPEAEDQEAYGYNTSWSVAHQLVEEIGVDAMSAVIRAAADRESPYPAQTDESPLDHAADWRTLLDLLEGVGGSAEAEQVFRDVVVDETDLALLDERAAARDSYDDLLDAGAGWAPPAALRDAMTAWAFDDAQAMADDVAALLDERDAIATDLAGIDEEVPTALQEDFEAADSLPPLEDVMADVEVAADTLVDAVTAQADANPVARVGLLLGGTQDDLDAARDALADGEYDDAAALAAQVSDDVAGATLAGALRIAGLLLLLTVVALGTRWGRRRRRRRNRLRALSAERAVQEAQLVLPALPALPALPVLPPPPPPPL